jgi:hypothetical protein
MCLGAADSLKKKSEMNTVAFCVLELNLAHFISQNTNARCHMNGFHLSLQPCASSKEACA